jgi:hypothetical protein
VLEVEGPCPFRFEVTFSAFDEPSYDQAQADELPSWQQRNPGGMGSIPVQKGQHSESALSADAQVCKACIVTYGVHLHQSDDSDE